MTVREPGAAADQPDGPPQAAPQNRQNGQAQGNANEQPPAQVNPQAQTNAPARRPAPRVRRSLPAMVRILRITLRDYDF